MYRLSPWFIASLFVLLGAAQAGDVVPRRQGDAVQRHVQGQPVATGPDESLLAGALPVGLFSGEKGRRSIQWGKLDQDQ